MLSNCCLDPQGTSGRTALAEAPRMRRLSSCLPRARLLLASRPLACQLPTMRSLPTLRGCRSGRLCGTPRRCSSRLCQRSRCLGTVWLRLPRTPKSHVGATLCVCMCVVQVEHVGAHGCVVHVVRGCRSVPCASCTSVPHCRARQGLHQPIPGCSHVHLYLPMLRQACSRKRIAGGRKIG